MAQLRLYLPTLQIEAGAVPMSAFNFSAPAGNLGVTSDITIPDVGESFNRGDDITLTLRHESAGTPKTRLIKNGRVSGDNRSIGIARSGGGLAPADSYTLKAVDQIAEKWKLAPRIPQILFDPQFITLDGNETDTNINDENGDRVFAEVTPVGYLDLDYILNFAYVDSCGFSEVIHNLPNYRIPRADFALNASFHSIAASFYTYFKPVVFEDDNRLFIVDIYGEIPAGILSGARNVQASKYISFQKATPERAVVNAVLLSHKEISVQSTGTDEFPDSVTFRTESDTQDVGTPFSDGWQRTVFTRFIAEIHDDEEDLAKITSEIVYKTDTTTSGYDEDGTYRTLSIETQTDKYSNSWRLKLGYTKTLQAYLDDGSGGKLLQDAQTEINVLQWKPSIANPGEWEKNYSQTQVEGLVLIEGEGDDEVRTPLVEASRNGDVPDDDSATISRLPISSSIEVWRYTGADQIEVHIQKIDQLTKRVESTKTVSHVGTNSVRVRNGNAFNTKQVLLSDAVSDAADGAREPITFDAGFIPYAIAKELALRSLDLAMNPRLTISCELASFDGGIRRGSIRNIFDRDGNSVTAIITGYSVKGTQAQRGQIVISQSVEGVVIG